MLSDLKTLEVVLNEPAVEVAMLWNSELDREPEHHDCKGVLDGGWEVECCGAERRKFSQSRGPKFTRLDRLDIAIAPCSSCKYCRKPTVRNSLE